MGLSATVYSTLFIKPVADDSIKVVYLNTYIMNNLVFIYNASDVKAFSINPPGNSAYYQKISLDQDFVFTDDLPRVYSPII